MKNPPDRSTQAPPEASQGEEAPERSSAVGLIELRPGLYLNPVQFIGVRVLPRAEDNAFAALTLSNGEKLTITKDEFAAITRPDAERSFTRPSQEIAGSIKATRRSKARTNR